MAVVGKFELALAFTVSLDFSKVGNRNTVFVLFWVFDMLCFWGWWSVCEILLVGQENLNDDVINVSSRVALMASRQLVVLHPRPSLLALWTSSPCSWLHSSFFGTSLLNILHCRMFHWTVIIGSQDSQQIKNNSNWREIHKTPGPNSRVWSWQLHRSTSKENTGCQCWRRRVVSVTKLRYMWL